VVGASLGGLHAVGALLAALPPGFSLPVALAQHRIDAGSDGLADYLEGMCSLTVREAEDKDELTPGTVLVAPSGYHMLVEPGSVALSTEGAVSFARPSVDVLFESAAQAYGASVLAIVLTGANTDGAAGAAVVRAAGGRVIVQDPETAESQAMPRAAIAAARPHAVLPIEGIAGTLTRLARVRARGGR
jgi:two-component system chemotaxis response regulator CheB